MTGAVSWMTRNHVTSNLLMLVLIVGGLVRGASVKQEVFPEVSLDQVRISVAYPGAGPEEVEEGILLQIEENLTGVDGIKEIRATAAEGVGTVTVELLPGGDPDRVLQDVKTEVDRIVTFPEDAEKPVISKVLNRREVISVVVFGDVPERTLREQAEAIRDDLLAFPDITQVDLSGVRPYEISVEVPEESLRRHGLTLDSLAQRLRRASLDLPGGTVKTDGGEVLLRTKERRYFGSEYAEIPVVVDPDGTQVRLGDIAEVRDTFRETDEFARFDSKPAAMVRVYRVGDQKPTEISRIVKDYVEGRQASLPGSLGLATWNDTSELLQSRMDLLLRNARLGLLLVFVVLGLFLEIRLALWVMLGIPISVLGAFLFLPAVDVSINMISLFAFILALGILVDDAIVVGENVYAHREMGKPYLPAAVDGALEVAGPVVFSVFTTVAAFVPLVFVSGMLGKFIRVIPLVVIALLLVSLVESLFVLPAHLSGGRRRERPKGLLGFLERVRRGFGGGLDRFVSGPYRWFLERCLRHRYTVLAAGVAVLLVTVGLIRGGILQFVFMPEVDGDVVTASVKMPRGTPVEETGRVAERLVEEALATVGEYDLDRDDSILRNVYAVVGAKLAERGPRGGETSSGSHLADVAVFLVGSESRGIPSNEIGNRWRQRVGEVPGAESLTFTSNMIRLGANIDVRASHADFRVLAEVAERLRSALAQYPGVGDIDDTYSRGKRELVLRLTPEARTLGVTEEDLGRQVRGAFFGAEALRLQRGRNEVRVMVRYPEADRRSLAELEAMRVRIPGGGALPLARAANVAEGRGFSEINRTDRKRVIDVTASVDSDAANAGAILEDLKKGVLADLSRDYPGLAFDLEGEEGERREAMESMGQGFLLALVAIFALLAIPFRSYSQPLLIMAAIPFGLVGAVLGHLLMGYKLSILSIFGVVALSGVVVNDSLLLIDRANTGRREGADAPQAVLDAAVRRFRPILLTSLTTFFGLAPMILEKSVQARFLIPMAISLGFGVLFATGITLLLIPCLYLALEDGRRLLGFQSEPGVRRREQGSAPAGQEA
jgi:multidrug efflux pump subunit AcrB